ncbi:hypothetical protein [Sunxiuqinia elliptica]|uniref:Uncharacterized protein n=1 Tax=Sunxiuqinia elliptica TaxID=655355 RepID=A0A4R6HAP7_9BACT|nr:hypothetical protein [Sunxiuqinia elliptica]TDO05440.1 hypothetical protein DET52_101800 [Sunxiuqinia elliptica]TDO64986.1 hypothetical protein DET65_1359 [Sunxiuqinia elliptica]
MTNEELTYQVSYFLENYSESLNYLVDTFTTPLYGDPHFWPQFMVDSYMRGNSTESSFEENIYKQKKGFTEFCYYIPLLRLMTFSIKLTEIYSSAEKFINEYDSRLEHLLKECIEKEKLKQTVIIINTTDFLASNHLKSLYDICQSIKTKIISTNLISKKPIILTGLNCPHNSNKIDQAYQLMTQKGFIECNLWDFKSVFSSTTPVINPVVWNIINERGTNAHRGNQTSLFVFLKLMINYISEDDRKKAKFLFNDKHGEFISKQLMQPDESKILTYGFEKDLEEILEKAEKKKQTPNT